MRKILQIIPAPDNLFAVWKIDGEKHKTPLACLALYEEDGDTHVGGIDAGDYMCLCEEIDNFYCYQFETPKKEK
jgi:hypothetical protein